MLDGARGARHALLAMPLGGAYLREGLRHVAALRDALSPDAAPPTPADPFGEPGDEADDELHDAAGAGAFEPVVGSFDLLARDADAAHCAEVLSRRLQEVRARACA